MLRERANIWTGISVSCEWFHYMSRKVCVCVAGWMSKLIDFVILKSSKFAKSKQQFFFKQFIKISTFLKSDLCQQQVNFVILLTIEYFKFTSIGVGVLVKSIEYWVLSTQCNRGIYFFFLFYKRNNIRNEFRQSAAHVKLDNEIYAKKEEKKNEQKIRLEQQHQPNKIIKCRHGATESYCTSSTVIPWNLRLDFEIPLQKRMYFFMDVWVYKCARRDLSKLTYFDSLNLLFSTSPFIFCIHRHESSF